MACSTCSTVRAQIGSGVAAGGGTWGTVGEWAELKESGHLRVVIGRVLSYPTCEGTEGTRVTRAQSYDPVEDLFLREENSYSGRCALAEARDFRRSPTSILAKELAASLKMWSLP
eukprot:5443569-Heterocapsa_arctica.AAC.1